jgi:hypothetical protein
MSSLALKRRVGLFGLFLSCGLLVSVFPQLLQNKDSLVISQVCISVAFLLISVWLRRKQTSRFFQVTFAFFIMSFAFLLVYLLRFSGLFSLSTVTGEFVFQITNAVAIIISIVLLTRISGTDMGGIYLQKGRLRLGVLIGLGIFLLVVILILVFPTGLSMLFFLSEDVTREKVP